MSARKISPEMTAWSCCGQYNDHAANCITLEVRRLREEIEDLKEQLERHETILPERDAWKRECDAWEKKYEEMRAALEDAAETICGEFCGSNGHHSVCDRPRKALAAIRK